MESIVALLTALWLGISASISPCPLATNIAAISFVSSRVARKGLALLSGVAYTLGRSVTYAVIGFLVVEAVVGIPALSYSLQHLNKILGLLLIVVGMFVLDLVRVRLPVFTPLERAQKKLMNSGIASALLLGVVFALAFCPVSAALFFGGLIPVAIQARSSIALPLMYGIGTGMPVFVFAILIAMGAQYVHTIYRRLSRIEFYTKRATGIIFIAVGIYYVLAYIFEIL